MTDGEPIVISGYFAARGMMYFFQAAMASSTAMPLIAGSRKVMRCAGLADATSEARVLRFLKLDGKPRQYKSVRESKVMDGTHLFPLSEVVSMPNCCNVNWYRAEYFGSG